MISSALFARKLPLSARAFSSIGFADITAVSKEEKKKDSMMNMPMAVS
jgi:hypothetical protein